MAISASAVFEVESGGSDTLNGGGFDPGVAGMPTDLAATFANTASPVVTSASYNFVAGDVGAWLYVKSGTSWIAGWYQIASVAANAATLAAAIGAGVLAAGGLTTALGCAAVASPTAGTWAIDYSQQASRQFAYTDLTAAGAGSTLTSAGHPFGVQQVGNVLVITSGTNLTTGRFAIASVSGTTATFDRAVSTGASSNGAGGLGGALASPGQAGAVMVAGSDLFIKAATYSVTSASSNVAGGCTTLPASASATNVTRCVGYQTTRYDGGTKPILQASGISTFTLFTAGLNNRVENLEADGASLTSSTGLKLNAIGVSAFACRARNCTANGLLPSASGITVACEVTGCSASPAMSGGGTLIGCVAHDNTANGFQTVGAVTFINCLAFGNSGAGTDGFQMNVSPQAVQGCVAYNNGRHGFNFQTSVSGPSYFINSISVGNGGWGFRAGGVYDHVYLQNCAAYNNTSGGFDPTTLISGHLVNAINLSGDPFLGAVANNFALNNVPGGGAACRAAGFPSSWPSASTFSYPDIGAAQHADQSAMPPPILVARGDALPVW